MIDEKVLRDAVLKSCFVEHHEDARNFEAFKNDGWVVMAAFDHLYGEEELPNSICIDEQVLLEFFIREKGPAIYDYESAEQIKEALLRSTENVDDEDAFNHFGLCNEDKMSWGMRCVLVGEYAKACELGDLSESLYHIIRKVKELLF